MPKRKGGRKKRGGSKQNPLANPGNVHNPKNFGSDQGLISGCAGCVGGNIAIGSGCTLTSQAAAQESATRGISRLMNGIRGQVGKIQTGGGNTATTTFKDLQNAADGGLGYGRVPVTSVTNCGVTSSTSMGAGQRAHTQKGGGVSQTASCVAGCNNLGTPGYGLNVKGTSDLNATLMGSGYPAVSPYNTNKCGGRRTRKRRKHKKRRRRTKRKRKKKRRRTRRKRGGDVSTLQKMTQKWQQYIGFPPQLRGGSYKKRRKRKGGKRKTMKGGYAQFASNDPMTPGFSSPKPGPLPWATGPLSKSRQINCQDNYDHYTGKSSPSPVLDQAAPVTPFGGTA
jgi:hypothetical protein